MSFDKQRIIEEFNLKPFGQKGWYRSNSFICPNCGQSDEFAVLFVPNGGIVHCLHGKTCNNYKTSLHNYLKVIGKADLVNYEKSIELSAFPSFYEEIEVIEGNMPLVKKNLPIAFKRINFDSYLKDRNFLPEHYEIFEVGETRLHPSLKGYNIFQFFNRQNECVAWMARSKQDKKWHDENLKKYKAGKCDLKLRYQNSPNTDFSRVLGGESEITGIVDTLILVEGIMDKVNVDKQLGLLDKSSEIKCCFTFGNVVSDDQIDIIKQYKNIKNIYLLYDEGTINQSKHYGLMLSNICRNVNVCEIKQKNLDPGEMTTDQLIKTLERSVNSVSFNFEKIDGIVQ